MKIHILSLLVGFLFAFGFFVTARYDGVVIASPGVLPDNVFAVFQDIFERFQLLFTFSHEGKAKLHLQFAERRLAELNQSIALNKTDLIPHLAQRFEREMNETRREINETKASGQNVTELAEHVAAVTFKHQLVLQDIKENVPDQAKDDIAHAINVSSHGHESAVENILEQENISGVVNVTFIVGNQSFTETFNVTTRENQAHIEKESEHNQSCEENCNQTIRINPAGHTIPQKAHEEENKTSRTNATPIVTTAMTRGKSGEHKNKSNSTGND